jgi:hypothetical protein
MGPAVLHDLDLGGLEIDEGEAADGCVRNDPPGAMAGMRLRVGATWIALAPLAGDADVSLGFVRRPRA